MTDLTNVMSQRGFDRPAREAFIEKAMADLVGEMNGTASAVHASDEVLAGAMVAALALPKASRALLIASLAASLAD